MRSGTTPGLHDTALLGRARTLYDSYFRRQLWTWGMGLSLGAATLFPFAASASSTSEMFRTQALFALADGNFNSALSQLEQAVAADGRDLQARYYRGVALSRLGRYPEALKDLDQARSGGMAQAELEFELGYVHYRLGNLGAAAETLGRAVQAQPKNAQSHYYLGLCYYKQGRYEAALEPLRKAAQLNTDYGPSAAYMRGDALARLGRLREADRLLNAALQQYPESVYAGAMAELLAAIEKQRDDQRPYRLSLSAGVTYDDNVGLFAENNPLPASVSSGSDTRSQLSLDARARLLTGEKRSLGVDYRFFQSSHQTLKQYDLQTHSASARYRQGESWGSWGGAYTFRRAYLGGNDYSDTQMLLPTLTVKHGGNRLSLLQLQLRTSHYLDPAYAGRDGDYRELRYRHYWLAEGNDYRFAGVRVGTENTELTDYTYHGYGAEVGLARRLDPWELLASLSYEARRYDNTGARREDQQANLGLRVNRDLGRGLELGLYLNYIHHPSSLTAYDYRRTLGGVELNWEWLP